MNKNITHSAVPYSSPSSRALGNAQITAFAFLAAIGVECIPILIKFLVSQDFSRTALVTLASTVGVGLLTVLLTYATKFGQAKATDIKPTMTMADVHEAAVRADAPSHPAPSPVVHKTPVATPGEPLEPTTVHKPPTHKTPAVPPKV